MLNGGHEPWIGQSDAQVRFWHSMGEKERKEEIAHIDSHIAKPLLYKAHCTTHIPASLSDPLFSTLGKADTASSRKEHTGKKSPDSMY